MTRHIGLLVFPDIQQLDMTGPYDVFASLPDTVVHLIWKTTTPLRSSSGLLLTPDTTFAQADADLPALDVFCIPGGAGVNPLMEDAETLDFVRRQASRARFVTSVCTGALVLGAAGLLRGKRATTHWASQSFLSAFGAELVRERVVRDGNLITGGGVTAGIDFALTVVAELLDEQTAQSIQLGIEYAPAPPFNAGTPDTAPANVLALATQRGAASRTAREAIVARVAQKLA